jgi:hypothetical protein
LIGFPAQRRLTRAKMSDLRIGFVLPIYNLRLLY